MLFTLIAFALALGVLVTFHELGHYWVARLCGVRVLRFSVGFGKVLARRTDRHGTEWALSAIPLGGYVKMLDDAPEGASPAEADQAFNRKTLGQRSAIVMAGPFANLLLAAILYTLLNLMGTSEPAAVLAPPAHSTAAEQAGLLGGDRILAVNDQPVKSWSEVRWQLLDAVTSGGGASVTVEGESGAQRERILRFQADQIEPDGADPMAEAGLALALPRPVVKSVNVGSPGAHAGLREGDIILSVEGVQQPTAQVFIKHIQEHAGKSVPLTVLRDGAPVALTVAPKAESADGREVGRIGVMLGADFPMVTVRYGLFDSARRGVTRTVDTVWLSLKMMGRMVVGDISLRNVSGPVTIADYAGQTARIGLAAYIGFLALISVSIGVLNLLPIPMLDGGHLMYYAVEAIRGKPVPEKWLENGQRVGLGLLVALMGLAFFNDFSRLFS